MRMFARMSPGIQRTLIALGSLALTVGPAAADPPKFLDKLFGFGKKPKQSSEIAKPLSQLPPSRLTKPSALYRSNDQYLTSLLKGAERPAQKSFAQSNPMLSRSPNPAPTQPPKNAASTEAAVVEWLAVTKDPPPSTAVANAMQTANAKNFTPAFHAGDLPVDKSEIPVTPPEYANVQVPGLPNGAKVMWVKDRVIGDPVSVSPPINGSGPIVRQADASNSAIPVGTSVAPQASATLDARRASAFLPPATQTQVTGVAATTVASNPATAAQAIPATTTGVQAPTAAMSAAQAAPVAVAPTASNAPPVTPVTPIQQQLIPQPPAAAIAAQAPIARAPVIQTPITAQGTGAVQTQALSHLPPPTAAQFGTAPMTTQPLIVSDRYSLGSPMVVVPPTNSPVYPGTAPQASILGSGQVITQQMQMPMATNIVNGPILDERIAGAPMVTSPVFPSSTPMATMTGTPMATVVREEVVEQHVVLANQHLDAAFQVIDLDPERAEEELLQALTIVAQARDRAGNTRIYTEGLSNAITAMWEADEFARVLSHQGEEMALTLAAEFTTPVGKSLRRRKVFPRDAVDTYHVYARQSLVIALGQEKAASRALYGMARLFRNQAKEEPDSAQIANTKAMTFLLSSAAVDQKNWKATNELGVMFASQGKLVQAENALKRSIKVRPTSEAWNNLARVYETRGNSRLADAADARSYAVRGTTPPSEEFFAESPAPPMKRLLSSTPVLSKAPVAKAAPTFTTVPGPTNSQERFITTRPETNPKSAVAFTSPKSSEPTVPWTQRLKEMMSGKPARMAGTTAHKKAR